MTKFLLSMSCLVNQGLDLQVITCVNLAFMSREIVWYCSSSVQVFQWKFWLGSCDLRVCKQKTWVLTTKIGKYTSSPIHFTLGMFYKFLGHLYVSVSKKCSHTNCWDANFVHLCLCENPVLLLVELKSLLLSFLHFGANEFSRKTK